jgi:hypothetical protein
MIDLAASPAEGTGSVQMMRPGAGAVITQR